MKTRLLNRKVSVLSLVWIFLTFLPLAIIAQDKNASKEKAKMEKQMKKLCHGKKVYTDSGLNYIVLSSEYQGNAAGLFSSEQTSRLNSERIRDEIMNEMKDVFYFGYSYSWDYNRTVSFSRIYTYKYYFLPKSGKTNDVFPNQTIGFTDINKKGKGYIYIDNRYKGGYYGPNYRGEQHFVLINDVNWSGEIKNGCLEGIGEGYCIYEANDSHSYHVITYMKGQFHNGKPTGECVFFNIYTTHQAKIYNLYTLTQINWYNESRALLQFNGNNKSNLYLNDKMEFRDIDDLLMSMHSGGFLSFHNKWNKPSFKFVGFSGDNIIARGTAYRWSDGTNNAILMDSVKMEILVCQDAKIVGLSEKGKEMVTEYLNNVASSLYLLTKVYNTSDLSDPINNLKKKYNIDHQKFIHNLIMLDDLKKYIPDVNVILENNKELSTRISLVRDLVDVYQLLNDDDVAEVKAVAERFDVYDAVRRPVPSKGIMWTIHNWVGSPTRVTDKRMSDIAEIDKMVKNPLFPNKDQNVANMLKNLVESKKAAYKKNYPQIYEIAESRLRKAQNNSINEDEIIETNNIPEIASSDEDLRNGDYMYSYTFKDGVVVIIHRHLLSGKYEYSFYLYSGNLKQAYYSNLSDATCAAYFWKKYQKLRRKGKISGNP